MSFATLDNFKARLAILAGDAPESGSPDEITATGCLSDAYDCIVRTLLNRQITEANIALWKEGKAFELDIATYFYGQRQGWEKRDDDNAPWIARFDKRKQLKTMPILLTDGTVIRNKITLL